LYPSPNIISVIKSRRIRWARHVARVGEIGNAYNILVGKPEGKIQLGWNRSRWKDNIRMDLRKETWGVLNWTHLNQDRDQ